jgi:hypothetical protein
MVDAMTGFNSKRDVAADKLQDGKCKLCVDGCAACDARAQPAQEPVAWMSEENNCIFFDADKPNPMDYDFWTPLYTTPPKRPWVGLTDDEHCDIWYKESLDWMEYGKAIEAKLKEKNA